MDSGLLESYEYVIKSLYKAGLPEGNIFDFAASRILRFEHKWNTEQKKKAILERYKNYGKEKEEIKIKESSKLNSSQISQAQSDRSSSPKSSKGGKGGKKGKSEKGKVSKSPRATSKGKRR